MPSVGPPAAGGTTGVRCFVKWAHCVQWGYSNGKFLSWSWNTLDHLFILSRIFSGANFAQPLICFVGLEKALDDKPQGIQWEVLQEY